MPLAAILYCALRKVTTTRFMVYWQKEDVLNTRFALIGQQRKILIIITSCPINYNSWFYYKENTIAKELRSKTICFYYNFFVSPKTWIAQFGSQAMLKRAIRNNIIWNSMYKNIIFQAGTNTSCVLIIEKARHKVVLKKEILPCYVYILKLPTERSVEHWFYQCTIDVEEKRRQYLLAK